METNLYRAIVRSIVETRGNWHTADAVITELIEWGVIDANDPEVFKFTRTWEEMTNEMEGV